MKQKQCGLCKKILPESEFYDYRKHGGPIRSYCRHCACARSKTYYRLKRRQGAQEMVDWLESIAPAQRGNSLYARVASGDITRTDFLVCLKEVDFNGERK